MTFDRTIMDFYGSYQENGNDFSFELYMYIIRMLDGTYVYNVTHFFNLLFNEVSRISFDKNYTLNQLTNKFQVHKDHLDKAFNKSDCIDIKILLNNLKGTRNSTSGLNATLAQQNNSSNGPINHTIPNVIYCFYDKDKYDKHQYEHKALRKKHPLLLSIFPTVRDLISFHKYIKGHLLSHKVLFESQNCVLSFKF